MKHYKHLLFLAVLCLSTIANTTYTLLAAEGEPELKQTKQATELYQQLAHAERKGVASFSCLLKAADTGEEIFSYQPNRSMIPASTTKLFTTAAATLLLDSFPFVTDFRISGRVQNGTLVGDLIIVGSGDPTIYSKYFPADSIRFRESLLAALHAHQIKRVEGAVVVNAAAYDRIGFHPEWMAEDRGEWYANGVYGFNIFDNWIKLTLSTGSDKYDVSILRTYPPRSGVEWDNQIVTSKRGGSAEGDGLPLVEKRTLKGTLPTNRSSIKLSVDMPHPPYYAARFITYLLQDNGIEVAKAPEVSFTPPESKGKLIGRYWGPKKGDILHATNYFSLNHYAETLLKAMARGEKPASTEAGIKCELQFFKEEGLKFSESFCLVDGSGLARANRFTANDMAILLHFMMHQDKPLFDNYLYSLPEAGSEGTVRRFLSNKPYNSYLKSGSMSGVQCYAGYIDYQGRQYLLVLMANNVKERATTRTLFSKVADLVTTIE